jgi:hypothetical protein
VAGIEGLADSNPSTQYVVQPASHDQSMSAMDLTSELSSVSAASNSVPPWANEDFWQKYLTRFGPTDKCSGGGQCEMLFKEHYHCLAEGCEMIFR